MLPATYEKYASQMFLFNCIFFLHSAIYELFSHIISSKIKETLNSKVSAPKLIYIFMWCDNTNSVKYQLSDQKKELQVVQIYTA